MFRKLDGDLEGKDVGILLSVAVVVRLGNWVGLMVTDGTGDTNDMEGTED